MNLFESDSMHELGILQSMLQMVEQHAHANKASKVHKITLKIGAWSGVEIEALRFAFEVVAHGTLAADSELIVIPVPALAHCKKCVVDFPIQKNPVFACPQCGEFSGDIRSGRELELTQIEMS